MHRYFWNFLLGIFDILLAESSRERRRRNRFNYVFLLGKREILYCAKYPGIFVVHWVISITKLTEQLYNYINQKETVKWIKVKLHEILVVMLMTWLENIFWYVCYFQFFRFETIIRICDGNNVHSMSVHWHSRHFAQLCSRKWKTHKMTPILGSFAYKLLCVLINIFLEIWYVFGKGSTNLNWSCEKCAKKMIENYKQL